MMRDTQYARVILIPSKRQTRKAKNANFTLSIDLYGKKIPMYAFSCKSHLQVVTDVEIWRIYNPDEISFSMESMNRFLVWFFNRIEQQIVSIKIIQGTFA